MASTTASAARAAGGQAGGSLTRVLARVFKEPRPEILDLGPMCGQSVVYLAQRGARVHVDSFEPPPPTPPTRKGEPPPVKQPLSLDQPDERFHLVLAWEHLDFVPPDRVGEFVAEIRRVLRDGGWVFLFSLMKPSERPEVTSRYRLLADGTVCREAGEGRPHRRWLYSTRDIERALKGFSVQSLHLQRNQMREFAAVKVELGH